MRWNSMQPMKDKTRERKTIENSSKREKQPQRKKIQIEIHSQRNHSHSDDIYM